MDNLAAGFALRGAVNIMQAVCHAAFCLCGRRKGTAVLAET
nr:hypothetical protein [uncultured Agathobaculum sp.]